MAHRPAILQWIVNPEASFGDLGMGLLRAIQPWNEWIMGWGFDISKGEPQVTEAQVRARLNTFVGEEVQQVEIEKYLTGMSIRPGPPSIRWGVCSVVAMRYIVIRHRVV